MGPWRMRRLLPGPWIDLITKTQTLLKESRIFRLWREANGYHFGVLCCAGLTAFVFLLNSIGALWALNVYTPINGLGTLQEGSCKKSSRLGFWAHLLINVLSTALLGASNYTMQCLSSPTRGEIDRAHANGQWLDIGIPSMRNIWRITPYRRWLWWALAFSSIPLHLLWNSAVFVSLSSYSYNIFVVPNDFARYNTTVTDNPSGAGFYSNISFILLADGLAGNCLNATPAASEDDDQYRGLSYASACVIKYTDPQNNTFYSELDATASIPTGSYIEYRSQFRDLDITTLIEDASKASKLYMKYSSFYNYPTAIYPRGRSSWESRSTTPVRDVIFASQSRESEFERLEVNDCWKEYQGPILSSRQDVLLVSSVASNDMPPAFSPNNGSRTIQQAFALGLSTYIDLNTSQLCRPFGDALNPFACTNWTNGKPPRNDYFSAHNIEYCLSRKAAEKCKLQYSTNIMLVVVMCNFIKVLCMLYVVWIHDTKPLVTVGDAVASFLKREDSNTSGLCLAGVQAFRVHGWNTVARQKSETISMLFLSPYLSSTWRPRRRFQFESVERSRWALCLSLYFVAIGLTIHFLLAGVANPRLNGKSLKDLWALGLGTVTPSSIITAFSSSASSGIVAMALLANAPQLLLSVIYVTYNSLFTSIHTAREWQSYAKCPKGLRVTLPEGAQRSTFWLQLPYYHSLPLIGGSASLHWLVSQSIFLANITAVRQDGKELPNDSISTCGYSNLGLICVLLLGGLLIIYVLCLAFIKLDCRMPIARSCSAAISAACHPPETDIDAATKKIQWGVVKISEGEKNYQNGTAGHCTFSSLEVTLPIEGNKYT